MATDYPGYEFIQARYQYDGFPAGPPKYLLTHCLQCDHKLVSRSLATGWLQGEEQHSVHGMTDPFEGIQCVHNTNRALHCGNGNSYTLGFEHTGFAEDSEATWNSPDALKMLAISAKNYAWVWVNKIMPEQGITYLPKYLSVVQIAEGVVCGLVTHNDARIVWGNTTHWDPGPNFPYALHQQQIQDECRRLLGISTPPVTPTKPTTPTEDDEAMTPELTKALADINAKLDALPRNTWLTVLKNKASAEDNLVANTTRLGRIVDALLGKGFVRNALTKIATKLGVKLS